MAAEKLGLFIDDLRKEKNMTQADLAQKLNITVQAVSKWEGGKGLPSINTIEPLAKEPNVSVLEIMKATRMDNHIPQEEMNTTAMEISFGEQYEKTMSILNHFEIRNDKTYIYYKGFAKSKTTGEVVSISKTVVLDFVLTKNMP